MNKSDKPDDPKKRSRSTRADQIQRELKKSTYFKHQHVDEETVRRKAKMLEVLQHGTESKFRETLRECGWNEDSLEGMTCS